ncbi:MAG: hypothetical protein IKD18_05315 [Clostridia bacterium]|nr:hypothetical protein [Clostridia bacterium]
MMKRILALFLCILFLIPAVGCADEAAKTETLEETVSEEKKTEIKKEPVKDPWKKTEETENSTEPVVYAKVDEPMSKAVLDRIPIANSSMSTDQLRDICVEYMQLSITFQWVASQGLKYTDPHGAPPVYKAGGLYGGIPYVSQGSGNLYRWLLYLDPETGIMDMSTITSNLRLFGTACSGTASTAWARVVNSSLLGFTGDLNAKNGCIPLGPYQYDQNTIRWGEDGFKDCSDVAQDNSEQVMYESYALVKKADCLVANGHVTMANSPAVVVRNPDGTINGEESYIMQCEQGLFNTTDAYKRTSADGTEYRIQSDPNFKTTFARLRQKGYLPHTFAEFLGTDPVEKGNAYLEGVEGTLVAQNLTNIKLIANYGISDIFTTIRDADGNVVLDEIFHVVGHYGREQRGSKIINPQKVITLAREAGRTIEIRCQLYNGEMVTAFQGNLIEKAN